MNQKKEKPNFLKIEDQFLDEINLVQNYLKAVEERNFKIAGYYLADNFNMIFPGGNEFSNLIEMSDWAKTRYLRVSKYHEVIDVTGTKPNIIVYVIGQLNGEWLDGRTFSQIRFIDRFKLKGLKIVQQLVWNDLGETD